MFWSDHALYGEFEVLINIKTLEVMRAKKNTARNCTFRITPSMPWRIEKVRPLRGYRLKVLFLDGTKGEVDASKLIMSKEAGVFAALRDSSLFNKVYVEYGAVTWPGEIDLAPDAMYQSIKHQGKCILT